MSYLRDRAIILKNEPFREDDSRLTLYGRAHGKLVAVARGVRRSRSKQAGHLEPFNEIEVMIAKGAAFDKLAVAKTIGTRLHVRRHLGLLAVAGGIADLVDDLTRPQAPDSSVYDALIELLDLGASPMADFSAERGRLAWAACALKILDALGYAPQLDACVRCRATLNNEVCLAPSVGGLVCADCSAVIRREGGSIEALPALALRLLRFARRASLVDMLKVTAGTDLLAAACQAVESFLHNTHVSRAPKGPTTITVLLRN